MVQTTADNDNERVLERKRHILDAASKSFREKGFHATGMRDVAARAGMTVGNLYYYFENKEELLSFCQDETLGRLDDLVGEIAGVASQRGWQLGELHESRYSLEDTFIALTRAASKQREVA